MAPKQLLPLIGLVVGGFRRSCGRRIRTRRKEPEQGCQVALQDTRGEPSMEGLGQPPQTAVSAAKVSERQ